MALATTTVALIAVGVAAAAGGVAAYSSVKQGQFQKEMANQQAAEMEMQLEATKTQRSGEQLDESSQRLDRARQLDTLFREQRVAAASSGLMGNSFSAMQASDLSAYSREQNLTSIYTSSKDSNAALQLNSMKRQISSTKASGNFAQKMGMLNAAGGLLSSASSAGFGYNKVSS